jgi:hypothetical protein
LCAEPRHPALALKIEPQRADVRHNLQRWPEFTSHVSAFSSRCFPSALRRTNVHPAHLKQ